MTPALLAQLARVVLDAPVPRAPQVAPPARAWPAPGTVLDARLIEARGANEWLAEIDGHPIVLRLSGTLRSGQTIVLRVTAHTPLLTFEHLPDAASARARTQGPATPTPAQRSAAEAPALSAPAQRVAALTSELARASAVAPVLAPDPEPLLDPRALDPAAAAQTLRRSLAESGFFYESHQADWVQGRLDLARLLREPQARHAAGGTAAPRAEPAVAGAQSGSARRADVPSAPDAGRARADVDAAPAGPGSPRVGEALATPGLARSIVDAQLDAWVSRELVWHGQAWPGQPVALTVGEHAQHAGPYGDAAASWRSRLVLELPQLGPVELELHLAGNGVRVACRAVSGTAADALAGARDELVDALAARGLETRSVLVQNDDG